MANANAFSDMYKIFGDFKMPQPQMDFNEIFSSQRRNIEALSTASQAMSDGAQAITRRQAELARDNVEQCIKASREILTSGSPELTATRQAELARSMFETTLGSLREVSEMATSTFFEAMDVINQRVSESLEEMGQSVPLGMTASAPARANGKRKSS